MSTSSTTLRKSDIQLLERVFAAEIEDRLLQSKDRRYKLLEAEQYVQHVKQTMGVDRFGPITVEGWVLTHRGRIAYCEWASKSSNETRQNHPPAPRPKPRQRR